MLTIKVLGSGCANCKRLEQLAHKVVEDMGLEAGPGQMGEELRG